MEFSKIESCLFGEGRMEFSATASAETVDAVMRDCLIDMAFDDCVQTGGFPPFDELWTRLEQAIGKDQFEHYLKYLVLDRLAANLISAQDVDFVLEPAADSDDTLERGKPYRFSVGVILRPSFTLSSLDPVTMDVDPDDIVVTDFEVESAIGDFARRNVGYAEIDAEHEIAQGDVVSADMQIVCNGKRMEGISNEDALLEVDYQFMPRAFIDGVIGMRVGERKSFDFTLTEGEAAETGDGSEKDRYHAEIEIKGFRQAVVPTIDDAWLKANYPLAQSVGELKEILRAQIKSQKAQSMSAEKDSLVDGLLAERLQGAIPDIVYTFVQDEMMHNVEQQVAAQGRTMDDFFKERGIDENRYHMEIAMEVRETLRRGFALDTLFTAFDMTLDEADLAAAYEAMSPGHADQLRGEIKRTGKYFLVTEAARRIKAHNWLVQTAQVK